VLKMTAELQNRGVDVVLATTDADGPGRLPVELGAVHEHEGVPTIFFSRQFSEALKYSHPLSRWLMEHVRDFDCLHLHAVFSHSSLAAARACRRGSIPYIVRPLGSLESWSLRQKPGRKRLALALGATRMLRSAAAIHYTTERERQESERRLGLSNGVVIPLGGGLDASPGPVGPPSPASGEGPSQFPSPHGGEGWPAEALAKVGRGEAGTVLFLSRLHPKKGVELLLRAFAKVVIPAQAGIARSSSTGGISAPRSEAGTSFAGMTNADRRLVIAGSGDPAYELQLRRLAESLGIAERVVFAGWLDGEAKAAALAGADLFVLPSIQENFGLSVLEAMAAGVPVAVSREVDLSDEVAEAAAGWVFERTIEALSAALSEALADREELRRRGNNGREIVGRKFLWPVIAGELEGLYRRVCRPHPSGT
jgi:glycosyltransferase involved in cell wall biosynthesis